MRNNKTIIITGIVFLIIAVAVFLFGGYIAGWDFKGWFTSPTAIWSYVLIGIYILFLIAMLIWRFIDRL